MADELVTGDVLSEAEQIARLALVFLECGYHQCDYFDVDAGARCRTWVKDRYLFCKQHAIDAGLVKGLRRCRAEKADGKHCTRLAHGSSGLCWQHFQLKARDGDNR